MKRIMKTIALIPAAGVGSRMKQKTPKQFLRVNGKPLIVYTLEVFEKNKNIDEIVVVTLGSKISYVKDLCEKYSLSKVGDNIIVGGGTNGESIYNGIKYINGENDDCVIMIYDGDRCLITNEIINRNLECFIKNSNAVTVAPIVEALYRANDGESVDYISRENLFKIQTPYSYSLKSLMSMYREAKDAGMDYKNVAPCILMQLLGKSSHIVVESDYNFKITYPEDLEMFKLIKKYSNTK